MSKARQLADNGASTGHKNLVRNGGMQVHQRGGTITAANGAVTYTLDRMAFYKAHAGTNTIEQSTVAPVGFSHSLKFVTTVADASVASGDRVAMIYRMEGLDAAKLEFGSGNAKTITISFYVRSSITGTHGGAVGNGSDNRAYPFTYTISSADTWERKSITIPGDTTGTWATTNARSLQVAFGLGVGSTYSGSAGAWEAADRNSATGATTGILTTANANWYMTGFQIEIGSYSTPFEHKSYAQDLIDCQRYYFKFLEGNNKEIGVAWYYSSSHASFMFRYPTTMRATPTGTDSTGTGYYTIYANGGSDAFNSVAFENGSTESYSALNNSEVSGTAGQAGIVRGTNASAKIEFDAEL
tara:strand:+ start:7289 stop:8356 length:1068 start_codon:yes stop_codon:yes gene_type:complete